MMAKKLYDLFFSFTGLLILFPLFLIIAVIIKFTSKGPVFYIQPRVGKNNREFMLYKFRTMKAGSDKSGLLTIGSTDSRITHVGGFLRKYKIDELPQLLNILKGDMSFVGPRPEVRKYVLLYSEEQMNVLNIKPGLTDYASLQYINEDEILASEAEPEQAYVKKIMPEKLRLNLQYMDEMSFFTDLSIIFRTIFKISGKK